MSKEKEKNVPALILSTMGIITLFLAISFVYFSLNGKDYTEVYVSKIQNGEITNPITELQLMLLGDSSEEAQENYSNIYGDENIIKLQTEEGEKRIIVQANIENLNLSDVEKELVQYMSVVLKLYNLHNTPFTSITPKIQVNIDKNIYSAEIIEGDIIIKDGEIKNPDAIIRTTYKEIFEMIENPSYAEESIYSERTSIELISDKLVLFSKGYLSLYQEFNNF